jgi:hypothetical protein
MKFCTRTINKFSKLATVCHFTCFLTSLIRVSIPVSNTGNLPQRPLSYDVLASNSLFHIPLWFWSIRYEEGVLRYPYWTSEGSCLKKIKRKWKAEEKEQVTEKYRAGLQVAFAVNHKHFSTTGTERTYLACSPFHNFGFQISAACYAEAWLCKVRHNSGRFPHITLLNPESRSCTRSTIRVNLRWLYYCNYCH